jgi:hypothetical protein
MARIFSTTRVDFIYIEWSTPPEAQLNCVPIRMRLQLDPRVRKVPAKLSPPPLGEQTAMAACFDSI